MELNPLVHAPENKHLLTELTSPSFRHAIARLGCGVCCVLKLHNIEHTAEERHGRCRTELRKLGPMPGSNYYVHRFTMYEGRRFLRACVP
jgi:hypothetical protein